MLDSIMVPLKGRFDALDRSHTGTKSNILSSLAGPLAGSSIKTLPATLPEHG